MPRGVMPSTQILLVNYATAHAVADAAPSAHYLRRGGRQRLLVSVSTTFPPGLITSIPPGRGPRDGVSGYFFFVVRCPSIGGVWGRPGLRRCRYDSPSRMRS